MKIPIYRTVEGNPEVERYSVPRYRLSLVKEAEIDWPRKTIYGPDDAYELARVIFEGYDRESIFVFLLDQKHTLIGINLVAVGSLTEALVHPREFFKAIILANAAAFIFVHNHPSGDPTPSREDRALTDRIKAVSDLVGVRMLDSMIAGDTRYFSYVESGVLSTMGQGVIRVGERGELKWPAENPPLNKRTWGIVVRDAVARLRSDPRRGSPESAAMAVVAALEEFGFSPTDVGDQVMDALMETVVESAEALDKLIGGKR